jgi:hypothetical protein
MPYKAIRARSCSRYWKQQQLWLSGDLGGHYCSNHFLQGDTGRVVSDRTARQR